MAGLEEAPRSYRHISTTKYLGTWAQAYIVRRRCTMTPEAC